jgi:hypothetical protein
LACDLNKYFGFGMSHLACNLEAFWLVAYNHDFFNTLTYGMGILAHGLNIEAYGLRNHNLVLNNWFVV